MLTMAFREISNEIEKYFDDTNYHVQSKIKFVLYLYSWIANVLETNYNLIHTWQSWKNNLTIHNIMILTKLEPEYMHNIIKS